LPHTPYLPPFFLPPPAPTQSYTLSLHDALPIFPARAVPPSSPFLGRAASHIPRLARPARGSHPLRAASRETRARSSRAAGVGARSEEHTSELQSPYDLVCRLLLEKKKKINDYML